VAVNRSAAGLVAVVELSDVRLEAFSQVGESGRRRLASEVQPVEEAPIERAGLTVGEHEFGDLACVPSLQCSSQCGDIVLGFALLGIQPAEVEQRAPVGFLGELDPLVAERDDHALMVSEREGARRMPALSLPRVPWGLLTLGRPSGKSLMDVIATVHDAVSRDLRRDLRGCEKRRIVESRRTASRRG